MLKEIEIEKLHDAEYNPRVRLQPGMKEYDQLMQSIEVYGEVEPVVWNERTGNVVGGHQRLAVLRDLGRKKVLCSVVDLTPDDEKVLNLALNKIKGQWDYDKLEDLIREIDDTVLTGFTADEIYILLAENEGDYTEEADLSEWDYEDTGFGSYVITLKFPSNEQAARWCEEHGFPGVVKPGKSTTVIRIGDEDD